MWIEAIWRYPVKSMAGERLDEADLGRLGVPGDRVAYVIDERGETVSARTRPRLLGLCGGLDDRRADGRRRSARCPGGRGTLAAGRRPRCAARPRAVVRAL